MKVVESGYKIDLHIHSVCSRAKDKGKVAFNTVDHIGVLAEKLNAKGVQMCAITDHDAFGFDMYKALKAYENDEQCSVIKVFPGIEFTVEFIGENGPTALHVIAVFNDEDEAKVAKIADCLVDDKGKTAYDKNGAFSEEKFLSILRSIDLDTVLIVHQKSSLTSSRPYKNDVKTVGEEKFQEFVYTDYFEAFAVHGDRHHVLERKDKKRKMLLNFFGRGSAFADDNTCAWFKAGDALVLIDFSQSAFPKLRDLDFSDIRHIFVLVTHTHGDHVSGIGTMIHYAYYVLRRPVTIIVPCEAVRADMEFLLGKLEGCHPDAFQIMTADAVQEKWFLDAILTEHAPSHAGKCFGYALCVNGQYVLYTGDTHTLAPYISNIMASGNYGNTVLYTEAASQRSDVHLFLQDHLNELLSLCEKGVRVFLMHLDNEEAIRKIIAGTPLRIVPL